MSKSKLMPESSRKSQVKQSLGCGVRDLASYERVTSWSRTNANVGLPIDHPENPDYLDQMFHNWNFHGDKYNHRWLADIQPRQTSVIWIHGIDGFTVNEDSLYGLPLRNPSSKIILVSIVSARKLRREFYREELDPDRSLPLAKIRQRVLVIDLHKFRDACIGIPTPRDDPACVYIRR